MVEICFIFLAFFSVFPNERVYLIFFFLLRMTVPPLASRRMMLASSIAVLAGESIRRIRFKKEQFVTRELLFFSPRQKALSKTQPRQNSLSLSLSLSLNLSTSPQALPRSRIARRGDLHGALGLQNGDEVGVSVFCFLSLFWRGRPLRPRLTSLFFLPNEKRPAPVTRPLTSNAREE